MSVVSGMGNQILDWRFWTLDSELDHIESKIGFPESKMLFRHHRLHRRVLALLGQLLQDFEQHVVGVDPFGLGFEVENHAVPQGGQIDAAHVLEADVVAAFQQGPHLGGQGQRLGAARAGAPAQILVGDRQGDTAPADASPASAARCSPARAGPGSRRGSASATA